MVLVAVILWDDELGGDTQRPNGGRGGSPEKQGKRTGQGRQPLRLCSDHPWGLGGSQRNLGSMECDHTIGRGRSGRCRQGG